MVVELAAGAAPGIGALSSFVGAAALTSAHLAEGAEYGGGIVTVGEDILTSQPLVDKLYEFYLRLLTRGWVGDTGAGEKADVAHAYAGGFYFPCQRRPVLSGEVDLRNDALTPYAGLILTESRDGKSETCFASVRRCPLPRRIIAPCKGEPYKLVLMARGGYLLDQRGRRERRFAGTDYLDMMAWPLVVRPDGHVWAGQWVGDRTGGPVPSRRIIAMEAATALNAWADKRFLWQVETSEPLFRGWEGFRTPLVLGVSEAHVKSLFYAREAPLTESGRKRPILHWVRAHERRLASGVDVDVTRHLRGVVEFEMAGFPFRVTSPTKG